MHAQTEWLQPAPDAKRRNRGSGLLQERPGWVNLPVLMVVLPVAVLSSGPHPRTAALLRQRVCAAPVEAERVEPLHPARRQHVAAAHDALHGAPVNQQEVCKRGVAGGGGVCVGGKEHGERGSLREGQLQALVAGRKVAQLAAGGLAEQATAAAPARPKGDDSQGSPPPSLCCACRTIWVRKGVRFAVPVAAPECRNLVEPALPLRRLAIKLEAQRLQKGREQQWEEEGSRADGCSPRK